MFPATRLLRVHNTRAIQGALTKLSRVVKVRKKKTRWNQTAWKAKCPIFKAIVAGFRGKVAKKNRTLGVPGGKKPWDIHEFHDINTGATGRMSPHHPMVCILPINNNPSETREQLV